DGAGSPSRRYCGRRCGWCGGPPSPRAGRPGCCGARAAGGRGQSRNHGSGAWGTSFPWAGMVQWGKQKMQETIAVPILLPVPQILQNPELPNGCEVTSLCEVLRFLGFDADKCDLADHYLPRSERWYGADPDKVYMGNPHLDDGSPETGYYCFAGPIVAAADAYLAG